LREGLGEGSILTCMSPNPSNLRLRLLSALILIPPALAVVYVGGWAFAALVAVFAGIALYEWLRLVDPAVPHGVVVFVVTAFALTMAGGAWQSPGFGLELGAVFTAVLFIVARLHRAKSPLWIAFGLPYLAGGGLAMLYLRGVPAAGLALSLYLLAVVWGTDSGAFVAGRLIGGPKLAPRISPKKTWAGLFGGMALAAALGYAVALGLGARRPLVALGLAVILAGVAQAGDLFKSVFKRRAGVKESGTLIPGHGGALDRIDGLVLAAMVLSLIEAVMGDNLAWW